MSAPAWLQLRFPAVSVRTAESPLKLPPFRGFPNGWSGTLEEFLAAVRSQQIALEQAPLATVVDQYLARRERLGLDEAGEFLHIASSLIDWKARLLLPRDPVLDEPDPRQEIVRTLEASARQNAPADAPESKPPRPESPAGLSLLDLMVLLQEIEQASAQPIVQSISAAEVTVAEQLRWLTERLPQLGLAAQEADLWFALHPSLPAKICLFLALLELSKQGRIRLEQQDAFGSITVKA